MYEFLAWLQGSALGHVMRMGVWTYAVVNFIHILGIASFFGAVLVLDLRLLGLWKNIHLDAISQPLIPVTVVGFAVAVTSGVCLISANATEYSGNPFLYVKFPAIGLGLLNAAILNSSSAWKTRKSLELSSEVQRRLAYFGAVSLVCWLTAIGAGRMIGYW